MDYRKYIAIHNTNRKRILSICPGIKDNTGIYFFYRENEEGFKFGYVGQALKLLDRCSQHLEEYDHIALSLKKYGLYSKDNIYGYKLLICEENITADELDNAEKKWTKYYADLGYQLRNNTTGGQSGKQSMDYHSPKTYSQGKEYGYKKAYNEIAELFNKYLDVSIKGNSNSIKERKLKEFLNKISK